MSRFIGIWALLLTFSFTIQAKAGLIVDPTFDGLHIADAAEITAVGALVGIKADGTTTFLSTMFMTDHYNGMTAAHSILGGFESYAIRIGGNFREPGKYLSYDISDIVIPSSYTGAGQGNDYALLHFYDGIFGLDPLNLYDGPNNVGDTYRFVGGGRTGNVGSDITVLDGNFRGGYNVLEGLSGNKEYLRFEMDTPGSTNFTDLEILPWGGDSGSPVMALSKLYDDYGNLLTTEWQVAAVVSASGINDYNALFSASLIDSDWINQNRYVPESTAVPEPASIVLLGMGSVVLGGRRIFKRKKQL